MHLPSDPPRPASPDGGGKAPSTQQKDDDPPTSVPLTAVHLARFEFSDHGTKILMVEWHPEAIATTGQRVGHTKTAASATAIALTAGDGATAGTAPAASKAAGGLASVSGPDRQRPTLPSPVSQPTPIDADNDGWIVSWPGKKSSLLARDDGDEDDGDDGQRQQQHRQDHSPRRRVLFLLPTEAQIPATVTISHPGYEDIQVKALPAIFPDGLDPDAGPRGVLHTIWAKKRLAELDREMKAEFEANTESVGVDMALEEKQWIQETFLQIEIGAREDDQQQQQRQHSGQGIPKAPATGKLAEKLRGLRLATSPADLMPRPANTSMSSSAFSSSTQSDATMPSRSAVPTTGATSIDSVVNDSSSAIKWPAVSEQQQQQQPPSQEDGEGLFALPMSPRSPEMKRSPFSTLS